MFSTPVVASPLGWNQTVAVGSFSQYSVTKGGYREDHPL